MSAFLHLSAERSRDAIAAHPRIYEKQLRLAWMAKGMSRCDATIRIMSASILTCSSLLTGIHAPVLELNYIEDRVSASKCCESGSARAYTSPILSAL